MAKKSFKGENPALRYISVQDTDGVQNTDSMYNKHNINKTQIAQNTEDMHIEASGGKETKSKRLNVLIRPSLYETATKVAHMQRISVNELIHLAMERYVGENEEEIERYEAIYGNREL